LRLDWRGANYWQVAAFAVIKEQAVAASAEVKAASKLQHHHIHLFASDLLVHLSIMSSMASQHQARPLWAVNSIVTQAPAIQIADPFDNVPRPPPPPSDAIIQNTINIGTMFGTEKDQTNPFLRVNTAVNLYARRLVDSTEVWVLCHFTQTTDRDSIYALFPDAAEMQQFQSYTLTWTVWDSYANFVNTTFKSLNQRHFRTIPTLRYAQLPDKHHLFDGV
jgi:hypothetical protein